MFHTLHHSHPGLLLIVKQSAMFKTALQLQVKAFSSLIMNVCKTQHGKKKTQMCDKSEKKKLTVM
jgi:hypothetical protein